MIKHILCSYIGIYFKLMLTVCVYWSILTVSFGEMVDILYSEAEQCAAWAGGEFWRGWKYA